MDAFAGVVDATFAAFGIDAVYTPTDGDPIAVRAIARRPDTIVGFGEARKRAKLLGDSERCVIGQHHAAGADTDGRGALSDMCNQNGSRGTCDARHVVMLSEPVAPEPSPLGTPG